MDEDALKKVRTDDLWEELGKRFPGCVLVYERPQNPETPWVMAKIGVAYKASSLPHALGLAEHAAASMRVVSNTEMSRAATDII